MDAERKRGCGTFAQRHIPRNDDDCNASFRDSCTHGDSQDSRHLLRLRDQFAVVAAIFKQMLRVRLLKVAASNLVTRNLCRNCEHGDTIPMTVEEAVDEVKIAWAATARTYGKLSGKVSLGSSGKGSYLFMSHMQPFDLFALTDDLG